MEAQSENLTTEQFPTEVLAVLRRHNLHGMLVRAEVVASAVREIKIEPTKAKELLQHYRKSHDIDSDEKFTKHLQQRGVSQKDLQWQIELQLRKKMYARKHFSHKAEALFLAKKDQLDTVVYSLIRVKTFQLAREIFLRINEGECTFAEAAKQFSQGAERHTNGINGPASLTQAHPILAEKLRTTMVGELMEPFRIGEWHLLARLEQYRAAQFDETMNQKMCDELFKEWADEQAGSRIQFFDSSWVASETK